MTRFVVDANVAIKWVLPEIHTETAASLLGEQHELLVPDFFFSEIGNILWKRVRQNEFSLEQAKSYIEAILSTELQTHSSQSLIVLAIEIAVRVQQSVYDSIYLALAITHQCQMVTADQRFYNAVRRDVLATHLCWIEDFPKL